MRLPGILRKGPLTLDSAPVEEPVDSPSENMEGLSSHDDRELVQLEDDLAVIEQAMERVEEGDLDGYESLVTRFDDSDEPNSE